MEASDFTLVASDVNFRILVDESVEEEEDFADIVREGLEDLVTDELIEAEWIQTCVSFLPPERNSDTGKQVLRCDFRTKESEGRFSVFVSGLDDVMDEDLGLRVKEQLFNVFPKVEILPETRRRPFWRSSALTSGRLGLEISAKSPMWVLQILKHFTGNPNGRQLSKLGIVGLDGFATSASPYRHRFINVEAASSSEKHKFAQELPGWWKPVPIHAKRARFDSSGPEEGADEDKSGGIDWPQCMKPVLQKREKEIEGSAEKEAVSGLCGEEKRAGNDREKKSEFERHGCSRKEIHDCTEEEFLEDLMKFLVKENKKKLVPSRGVNFFPSITFNGSRLDLFNLYKEVVVRGGFKLGNAINWKGQIFPSMKNFTQENRATAVSAVLKKHYENFLVDYENAHDDVPEELCLVCKKGTDGDWINCVICESWVHFECDSRHGNVAFAEYARNEGKEYRCSVCKQKKRIGIRLLPPV